MTVTPDTPLTQFPGVGEVRAKKLSHLGLNTAGDLLTYYPRDYEDRRQVYAIRQAPEGVRVCVRAMVAQRPRLSRVRKGLEMCIRDRIYGVPISLCSSAPSQGFRVPLIVKSSSTPSVNE